MFGSSKGRSRVVVAPADMQEKSYAYHAHDVAEVLSVLNTSVAGLQEKEVESRLAKNGRNVFSRVPTKSLFASILEQISSPLAFVLVVACIITVALGEFVDAGVIAFALSIAVFVGVLQEGKASKAFERLANSQTNTATVIRQGAKHEIDAEDLVIGDVVILQSGIQVPADIRLITAKQLSINEAPLTGEWRAEKKQSDPMPVGTAFAEQASMAWMGTYVAEGYGVGVVTAIGDATVVGTLAASLHDTEEVATPLQHEMQYISKVMLVIVVALVCFIFVVGLVQGQLLEDMLLMAIAVAVASVPEGLPAAVTIILAVGMEALLKRGGLVRNLLAAETLGSTTYVLTDKTGTLTEAKMAVTGALLNVDTVTSDQDFAGNTIATDLFAISLGAIDAYTEMEAGQLVARGDSVEQAILLQAHELGATEENTTYRSRRIDYLPFTSEQRFAAGLSLDTDDNYILCINGAPELLLGEATHIMTEHGIEKMSSEMALRLQQAIATETTSGKRLIGVGYKAVAYDDIPEDDPQLINGLVFSGVLILDDPVRSGVAEAIAGVRSAGAEVVLITGDNPQTALSIAVAVGIAHEGGSALTGDELERMSDQEVLVALQSVSVFARVLPNQKQRIATLLQKQGEVVAMTGDGINDAPALRRANIGIAIGSGTEVAKEASDLVLVKDSFATIYAAIEEGRRIIANLRKIVGYLLSTSLSEVVLISVALIVGAPAPLVPAQILWANVIEEGLMSVAFAFEPGEKNAMRRKPQDIHAEGILSRQMFWFVLLVISSLSLLTVILYMYVRSLGLPLEIVRSVMFLSISMDSLFMAFAFRSLSTPIWRISLMSNKFFIGSFLISIALLIIVLTVPFFQYILSYTPLPASMIALVVAFSLGSLLIIELAKWLYFERR